MGRVLILTTEQVFSRIRILTNRTRNTDTAAVRSSSESYKKPIWAADAGASAHARSVKIGTRKQTKPRKQTSTRTTWPDGLSLSDGMRTDALRIAKKLGITLDLEAEFEAWHDDCLANADKRRYSDWPAAWRSRIRLIPKYGAQSSAAPRPEPSARKVQSHAEMLKAR